MSCHHQKESKNQMKSKDDQKPCTANQGRGGGSPEDNSEPNSGSNVRNKKICLFYNEVIPPNNPDPDLRKRKQYICDHCRMSFSDVLVFRRHVRKRQENLLPKKNVTPATSSCKITGNVCSTPSKILEQDIGSQPGRETGTCPLLCGKRFDNKSEFENHLKTFHRVIVPLTELDLVLLQDCPGDQIKNILEPPEISPVEKELNLSWSCTVRSMSCNRDIHSSARTRGTPTHIDWSEDNQYKNNRMDWESEKEPESSIDRKSLIRIRLNPHSKNVEWLCTACGKRFSELSKVFHHTVVHI